MSEFARRCGYYPDLVDDIKVAVGEACGNIIEHSQSTQDFILRCECQGDTLTIRLEDHGVGFKRQQRAPTASLPETRGYGMQLMRQLMDRVDYVHKRGNGTIVQLEKRKVQEPSPPSRQVDFS